MAIKVADFFCGCGGTSQGFQDAGLNIALGLDNDPDASMSYKANFPGARFIDRDIAKVTFGQVAASLDINVTDSLVFCGCAPCQPFSKINTKKPDEETRANLLPIFGGFVEHFLPDYVIVENVPGIQRLGARSGPFFEFLKLLKQSGYVGARCRYEVVHCQDYGVPQRRRRLVLIATRHGLSAPWPVKTHGNLNDLEPIRTVWDTISELPPIEAGGCHVGIPDHHASKLSPKNLMRIRATPPEKGRESWPEELLLECHKKNKGHTDVYGRLKKDAPAAALTTRCISLSNGRFGHPEQNRALSVREAALLQTFPMEFVFCGSQVSRARQIGNAVPVALATQIGKAIVNHDRHRRSESSG